MIRHLLKLAWSRKRANTLILVEIFFSFLVVFAVATLAIVLWTNARRPLGFDVDGVWHVAIDPGQAEDEAAETRQTETFGRVLAEAGRLERVEAAASALAVPYAEESWTRGVEAAGGGGPRLSVAYLEVTDAFAEVLALELVAGRWFEPSDGALEWVPVVIDREAGRDVFGTDDPVGRWLEPEPDGVRRRVVGVVSDFRQHGELSGPAPYMMERLEAGSSRHRLARHLVLKIAPGTGAEYERTILERLQGVAPEWTFSVRPLEVLRGSHLRLRLIPLGAVTVIAAFLMLMVALGLTGVLWQNVVQRTREIGLRRAAGASRGSIHRQLVAELLVVATLAMALGTALVVQLPILDLVEPLSPGVFAAGLATALAVIYLLAAGCALYPSWMAGRVQPAEALRWE